MVGRVCSGCSRALQTSPSAGSCNSCNWAKSHDKQRFGGNREAVLQRDGYQCRTCGASGHLIVHHRRPGFNYGDLLITLCRSCHAQVHGLQAIRHYVSGLLLELWVEQHPANWKQFQFDLPPLLMPSPTLHAAMEATK